MRSATALDDDGFDTLPVEKVRISLGDTSSGPYSPTSSGSATLATLGPAVRAAAAAAKDDRHGEGSRGPNPSDGDNHVS